MRKAYQVSVPRLKSATQVGAVWLFAIVAGLTLSPSGTGYPDLIWKVAATAFFLAGGIYLLKVGRDIDSSADNLIVLTGGDREEAPEPLDEQRRAA